MEPELTETSPNSDYRKATLIMWEERNAAIRKQKTKGMTADAKSAPSELKWSQRQPKEQGKWHWLNEDTRKVAVNRRGETSNILTFPYSDTDYAEMLEDNFDLPGKGEAV